MRSTIPVILLCCLLAFAAEAQRRPTLRPVNKDYFAGKILLIPSDKRPSSVQQPRLIAEVADHDLLTPPIGLLNNTEGLENWALEFDYDNADGVIISLDLFTSGNISGLLDHIRNQRPSIPIYAFISENYPEDEVPELLRDSLKLAENGKLDLLLISSSKFNLVEKSDLSAQKLKDRVIFDTDADSATTILLTRMLNRRFGYTPAALAIYSPNAANDPAARDEAQKVQQKVLSKVRNHGGIGLSLANQAAHNIDMTLFIHLAGTSLQDRIAMTESISQTLDKNLRVALVDLSKSKEARESLIGELRKRKMLDRLASYSAQIDDETGQGNSLNIALAQSCAFILSIRFLRDDIDRVRRIDRAQVRLLLSRYLTDYAWPSGVSQNLKLFLRDEMNSDKADVERAEKHLMELIKPLADNIFNEQFRRNIHGILLSSGERAQFEIRLLQRLQVRLYNADKLEPEITPSVYMVYLGNLPTRLLPGRTLWELIDEVDPRVSRRWWEINWTGFAGGSDHVEMRIKIDSKTAMNDGYRINSKLSGDRRKIDIVADSLTGAYHALGKLEQFGRLNKLSENFQVSEKPTLKIRGILDDFSGHWSTRQRVEMLQFMGRVRMNRYFYEPDEEGFLESHSEFGREQLGKLINSANENFITFAYVIPLDPGIDQTNELEQRLSHLFSHGIKSYALRLTLGFESGNSIVESNARLVSDLLKRIRRFDSNVELAVITDEPANRLKAFLSLIPREVAIVTVQEELRLNNAPSGREVIQQVRLGSDQFIPPFCPMDKVPITKNKGLIVHATSDFYSSLPILATAADFAWDSEFYDPNKSFSQALSLLYDGRTQNGMKQWRQVFNNCVQKTPVDKDAGNNESNGRLSMLRDSLLMLTGTKDTGLLRGELARRLSIYQ